jgi:uncharacterized protein (DUF2344 family)
MLNKLCKLKPGSGAWFINGTTLIPGTPFLMTQKLLSSKRMGHLISTGHVVEHKVVEKLVAEKPVEKAIETPVEVDQVNPMLPELVEPARDASPVEDESVEEDKQDSEWKSTKKKKKNKIES